MPSVNPSPFGPCPQFVDAAGDPAVGDQLFFYEAGTTTKQDTYTDSTGTVPNSNPILLDALGQPPEEVWFANGLIYKMVWAPSTDTDPPTNPIRTFDNLTGINDVQSLFSNSEWVLSGLTPSYINATQFEVPGNQTSLLTVGRRIKTENTSGTIYSTITDSVFGSVTIITVISDSGSLDSGLSSLDYGLISSVNPSLPNSQSVRNTIGLGSAQDIASAAALPLSTSLGNLVRVTGTTTTTSVVMSNGQQVTCVADGAWPVNIPGVLTYTCSAGDLVFFIQDNNGSQHSYIARTTPNLMRGYIDGLIMSTAGSSTTMTIGAGQATDSTNSVNLNLLSSIAKTTSAWSVGSGNGGLDTGTAKSSATGATCSFATNIMTCTVAPTDGTFQVGQEICAEGVAGGTVISSLGTGSGGTGTYNLSTTPGILAARATRGMFWYHHFIIQRPDTGVVDALFSLSLTPTLPANYVYFRRVGSCYLNGSLNWVKFYNEGNEFLWDAPTADVAAVPLGLGVSTNYSLTVPSGVKVQAFCTVRTFSNGADTSAVWVRSPEITDQAASQTLATVSTFGNANTVLGTGVQTRVKTNTSSQVRASSNGATGLAISITTQGWYEYR